MDHTDVMGTEGERLQVGIQHGDQARLTLVGELDPATAALFSKAAEEAVEAGATEIVIDMGGVTFVDSAGLRALIGAHKSTHPKPLVITNARPFTRQLLTITGLDDQFRVDERDAG